jgi:hypothetical protein
MSVLICRLHVTRLSVPPSSSSSRELFPRKPVAATAALCGFLFDRLTDYSSRETSICRFVTKFLSPLFTYCLARRSCKNLDLLYNPSQFFSVSCPLPLPRGPFSFSSRKQFPTFSSYLSMSLPFLFCLLALSFNISHNHPYSILHSGILLHCSITCALLPSTMRQYQYRFSWH